MSTKLGGINDYADAIWRGLPEDRAAFTYHRENPLPDSVYDEIGDIFVRHGVQSHFSLYLLHRHFLLEPGEGVVESGNVATPWPLRDAPDTVRASIAAKSWTFTDDKPAPFEFSFLPQGAAEDGLNEVPTRFIDDLGTFLRGNNLDRRFGITIQNESDPEKAMDMYETTIGRVSLLVPSHGPRPDDLAEVEWKFDKTGGRVVRLCFRCCTFHG